ncbi:glycoside hydrolase superfamily [Obelidium mucronatum]|nr:glycoside hydrolase superfamily [Obelidium mucronatum]
MSHENLFLAASQYERDGRSKQLKTTNTSSRDSLHGFMLNRVPTNYRYNASSTSTPSSSGSTTLTSASSFGPSLHSLQQHTYQPPSLVYNSTQHSYHSEQSWGPRDPEEFMNIPDLKEPAAFAKENSTIKDLVIVLGAAVYLAVHFILLNQPRVIPVISVIPSFDTFPPLKVSNKNIIYPNGTVWNGRGVNLGSYFIMNAIFGGYTGLEEFEFFNITDARWGQETSRELMDYFIRNAMVDSDWDFLKYLGFNFVRFPLHFRNFQWANGTWIRDPITNEIDWKILDEAIHNITSKGLYNHGFPADLAEFCQKQREAAGEFLGNLTAHVRGVPGILAIELMNENVPSYGNTLGQVLYNYTRPVDPDRILMHYYGVDRANPEEYGWTNMVYSFHTYDTAQNLAGFIENIQNKTSDRFNLPYYVSEMHFTDPADMQPSLKYIKEYKEANIPMWALWTYKAVNYDNWALVNYDSNFYVDLRRDSLEKIRKVWGSMPALSLQYSLSAWGMQFLPPR